MDEYQGLDDRDHFCSDVVASTVVTISIALNIPPERLLDLPVGEFWSLVDMIRSIE